MEDSIIPPPTPFPYSYTLKKKTHLEIIERASNMSMKYADDGNRNPQVYLILKIGHCIFISTYILR